MCDSREESPSLSLSLRLYRSLWGADCFRIIFNMIVFVCVCSVSCPAHHITLCLGPKLTSPVLAISLPCNKSLIKVNAPVHKLPKLHFCIGPTWFGFGFGFAFLETWQYVLVCVCVCSSFFSPSIVGLS